MHIGEFDYELPADRIATEPVRPRDASRMLVLDRRTGHYQDSVFKRLPDFLGPSDVVVLNDTRVLRARVHGKLLRENGTSRAIETLFVSPAGNGCWQVMCRPGKRIRPGDRVILGGGEVEGIFHDVLPDGLRLLELRSSTPVLDFLERHGHIPLPPYIEREDTPRDASEYQTMYASRAGAIAAPTAGLHFTHDVLAALEARGVEILKITLHVGVGTFVPVRTADPRAHVLKPEWFEITETTAAQLNAAREKGKRMVAVGTTTTRTLEYVIRRHGRFVAGTGETDVFILPGHDFQAVGALLTNFHLPKSTLLMLVSAFASQPAILNAYRHAVAGGYRFYSYGDCMLIL
jgi:S-adenosylmethionine:tRNA ribosyltransferase-isomerase